MQYHSFKTEYVIDENGNGIICEKIETYYADDGGAIQYIPIILSPIDRKYDKENGIITMLDGSGRVFTKDPKTLVDSLIEYGKSN